MDWFASMQPQSGRGDWYSELRNAQLYEETKAKQGAPLTDPATGRQIKPSHVYPSEAPPSTGTAFRAGTMGDQDQQIRFLAKQRFPDLPEPDAVSRYGIVNNEIVYEDDDGKLHREFSGMSSAAETLGDLALPTAGAIVGGVTGGPPGAALGAAGGEGYKKIVGAASGEQQSTLGNLMDMGTEAILNAVGWKVGDLFGKKIVDRRVVRDIAKFNREKAVDVQKVAKERFGIDLTPAEASDLGSLINQQTRLGMGLDEAGDIVRGFYKRRAQQVDEAVTDFIGSPPSADAAGAAARDASGKIIKGAMEARTKATRPMYERVVSRENLVPETPPAGPLTVPKGGNIFEDHLIKREMAEVTNNPADFYHLNDAPRNSLAVIDQVKKNLDDKIGAAIKAGERNKARLLSERRDKLVAEADRAFPEYREARRAFAGMSPEVEGLERGLAGVLSKVKDTSLSKSAEKVFNSANVDPASVAALRTRFKNAGHDQEWSDLLNVWLRDKWQSMKTPLTGGANQGAKFRQAVFGSKKQQEVMKAAMGPQRYELFTKLMNVLEATGRVPKAQSITEPAQRAAKREAVEAAPVSSALKVDITDPLGSFNLRDWWIDQKVTDWQTTLAKIITNPDSISDLEKLRKLKGLSPGSQDAINIVSLAVLKSGAGGVESVLDARPNRLPKSARR